MAKNIFPRGFFWGASTASHQVEGGTLNQWTEWELAHASELARTAKQRLQHVVPDWEAIASQAEDPNNYVSGKGVDHYRRYEEDFDLAKKIHLNAFRFSIEWSRIEPEEGKWNEAEIEQPETRANAQDLRVKLCRWLLWSITACQIFLVFVGCVFRFGGLVGVFVAFIPSAFLVAANAVAGDARFFDSTETAKLSAVFLSAVFGYLHFLTFRDVVRLDGQSEFWFSAVSATVVEVVAFSAIVLQQKISVEK